MSNYKYWTAERETGEFIDGFNSIDEAAEEISRYEEDDRKEGTYTPDFYDIVNEDHDSVDW